MARTRSARKITEPPRSATSRGSPFPQLGGDPAAQGRHLVAHFFGAEQGLDVACSVRSSAHVVATSATQAVACPFKTESLVDRHARDPGDPPADAEQRQALPHLRGTRRSISTSFSRRLPRAPRGWMRSPGRRLRIVTRSPAASGRASPARWAEPSEHPRLDGAALDAHPDGDLRDVPPLPEPQEYK